MMHGIRCQIYQYLLTHVHGMPCPVYKVNKGETKIFLRWPGSFLDYFCFSYYMPFNMLLCGPKIPNKDQDCILLYSYSHQMSIYACMTPVSR